MRGVTGLVLAGLGACLILVAVLLPTWVTGQVVKFPLNEQQSATLQANNASYFSATSLSLKTGVTMLATYEIKGDPSAGNSSTAVWTQTSTVEDVTNHQTVQQMTRTFAFNRRTAELVNCCGANINGNKKILQTGYAGAVWPFGTQRQTYQVFDTTLNKPMPFVYSGSTTIQGIGVYEFVENVSPTLFATVSVPGALLGVKTALVKAGEYDQLHLIYYVDPETGALLDVNEHQTVTLRTAAAAPGRLLFDADLIATPATVDKTVALDSGGRNELTLLQTTLPLVFGIAGGVALIAGVVLDRRPRVRAAKPDLVGAELAS